MDAINYFKLHWNWSEFCGSSDDKFPLWNPAYKDFDLCFQYLSLQLPILSLIAVVSAYYCGIHLTNIRRPKKETWVLRIRSCVTLFLSALPVIKTYVEVSLYPGTLHPVDYLISAVECFTWLVHFTYLIALFNRLGRSLRGPTLLGILWSLNYIMSCIALHTNYTINYYSKSLLESSSLPVVFSGIQVGLHTVYLLTLFPSEDSTLLQAPSSPSGEHSPLFGVYSRFRDDLDPGFLGVAGEGWNFLSRLTFSWVTPLLSKGRTGQLKTTDDLFELPTSLSSSYLYMKLRSGLTEESLYGTNRVTLFKALHHSFWKQFYGIGILKLISDVVGFFNPLLLHSLVTFTQSRDEPIVNGYLYAVALCLVSLISGTCMSHFNYMMTKVGLKIRGSLITTIYRKTLIVNTITLSQFSQGEILNFMSTDVDRIVNSCASFHSFWSIPFQLAVTLYLLYIQVGASFLAGVAFSIILIPINKAIASKIGSLSTKMMAMKDERLMLMSELLKGIKAVKFYVWEHVFCKKIDDIRREELKHLGGRKYLDAMCVYFWVTTPVLISISTFSVYVYMGHELTAPVVFTTMALLNMLIAPLNSFPWVLNGLTEAWVSLKRVQKLIELPEQDLDEYYSSGSNMKPGFILVNNGYFHWSESGTVPLTSINLTIKPGQFIGITGQVGSGKSSLLSAILAEIEKSSGVVSIGDYESGFGYVAQSPWLQRGSIKSNILFGEAFDHNIYCKVIEACALLEDLDIIPGGDEASVGEGGSTLSGGQRARIALARAVYKNHNVYLLDDILSAVDAHVANHLYTKCINGLLKNRTRLLCTHLTKYLIHADWVIVMKDGRITNQGVPSEVLPDYDEIVANNELQDYHSMSPVPSTPTKETTKPDKEAYQEEDRATGSLEAGVYTMYIKSVGVMLTLMIVMFISLMQASKNTVDWWMAYWVSSLNNTNSTFPNNSVTETVSLYTNNLSHEETTKFYLSVYLGLAGANSFLTLIRAFLFAYGGLVAARTIHKNLVNTVVWAKLAFFDITPLGRMLNRFSSDTYTIDDSLPFIINILLAQLFTLIGTLVMTLYGLPWLFLLLAPLVPVYHWIQNHYRHTSREIKRLTSISLSPLYNHFTETIQGLVTIRAFKSTSRFKRDNACHLETSQKAQLCASAVAQWLGFRLQMIGVLIVSGVGFLTVAQHHLDRAEPGLIGLALSYALTVTGSLGGVVNAFTETEREMVSVERVRSYLEGPESLVGRAKVQARLVIDSLPFGWPQFGVVSFNSVSLKYRDHLPLSLKNISFETRPAERIGVVGRTGAGKSSLIMAIFRLVDISTGVITIDGVNINSISNEKLRSRLGVIPQDPLVFNGTVKENLDPESLHTEAELLTALKSASMSDAVRTLGGLDANIRPNSMSVGQRQLLCLARAILRSPKIVCIDEATANVDEETDRLIQETIRSCFRQSTVITIAHRVSTVMDNDRVLVMGGGKVLEFDSPHTLLQDSNSHFYSLVHQNYS